MTPTKKYTGKKLLILGSSLGADSMVKYAQANGCYVIVADYLPVEKSSAKQIADESVLISTQDFDKLEEFARNNDINGIFCGVSEINLLAVRELCTRLNLPCYFTLDQWRICQQKRLFKNLCIKNGVPVPREYFVSGIDSLTAAPFEFPLIVKPVDGCAAKGITICKNKRQLLEAVQLALSESASKDYIIEEYVEGIEYTAVYTISDGEIVLSCLRDRFPTLDHENVTAQFDASVAPSLYYDKYISQVHPHIVSMLNNIGTKNGCLFFQGIVNDKKIVVFECGYRMNALLDYYNISAATGENYMEMLVNFALTGSMGNRLKKYDVSRKDYWCIFNMSCHGGTIAHLEGASSCSALKDVIHCQYLLPVGKKVNENNSMAQSVFRAFINSDSLDELKSTIKAIQDYVKVTDCTDNNMLFLPFDTDRLNVYNERETAYDK